MGDLGPDVSRGRAVTAIVGAILVLAALTGRAELYVRPWFVPVLFVTGAALAVCAWRGPITMRPAAATVLLIPVVVGLALPAALAGKITTFAGSGAQLQSRLGDGGNPLLAGAGGSVTLLDIYDAEQQEGAVLLDGREVTVEGVVDSGHLLVRLVMICCAADARPVSLPVRGTLPPKDTWVRVSGRLSAGGGSLALDARTVTSIPTPQDPFL